SSPRIIVGGGTIRVGAGTARDTGLAVASTGDWGIWVARFDGATTTFHYNGTQYGGSLDGGTNTGNQVICNQNSTAETHVAELIVYTGTGNPDEYFADAYAS
ncbi:MAG: hypothetical protein ACPGVG_20560, partial [Mycobacterium sp.]